MNQLTLFTDVETPAKLSRRSDPITSQQSAAEFQKKLKGAKAKCLSIMQKSSKALTAREISNACAKQFGGFESSYRARPSELVVDKVFEEAGERRCNITGKNAMTFRVRGQR